MRGKERANTSYCNRTYLIVYVFLCKTMFAFQELETSLFNKLIKIEACERMEMFEICRDLSYLADFLLLTEETLGERTVTLLRNILKIDNARAMGISFSLNYF